MLHTLPNFTLEKLWTCVWLFVPTAKGQICLIQPNSPTVTWPHGAPSQMQRSLEVLKTYGPILGRCILSSQGLLDLQVKKAASYFKFVGSTWFTCWLNTEMGHQEFSQGDIFPGTETGRENIHLPTNIHRELWVITQGSSRHISERRLNTASR